MINMAIQWSLVFFTVLTGMAGWLFACIALGQFREESLVGALPPAVASLVLAVAGGLVSVAHLSHPERMLEALNNPTSGIFVEAALVGLFSLCVIVFLVLVRRSASKNALRVSAATGAVFGILLSFLAGASYMMESQTSWNNVFLPLGYAATVFPLGVSAFLLFDFNGTSEARPFFEKMLCASGAVSLLCVSAYVVASGTFAAMGALWITVAGLSGAAPIVCGAVLGRVKNRKPMLSALSLVAAFAGAVLFRCAMWMASAPLYDFFQVLS